ncbi:MAG: GHKL domain-containing protein [Nitrospirae bacterium]|nr:GHKL domain-containing protein [Nitrospirota bacterium]
MSLKKKIALSFFISSFIFVLISATEYINFIDIRKEIRNLEISDTIRSKSLQLRRHEKNFFLYPEKADEEATAVYRYLDEMDAIAGNAGERGWSINTPVSRELSAWLQLSGSLKEYRKRFKTIESSIIGLSAQLREIRDRYAQFRSDYPLIQLTFREHPLQVAEFLKNVSFRSSDRELVNGLRALDTEIQALRKNGEDILGHAKEEDTNVRGHVERVISISQNAIRVVVPLFFISGMVTLFLLRRNVVGRLKLLTDRVEEAGKGRFSQIAFPPHLTQSDDEVGILIKKFNIMEEQLARHEAELKLKNEELLQSKKLAAIGTLASGVAHELNNPLNNIYISVQVLEKEAEHNCSPMMTETLHDIIGQTIRVKRIVGDLLEFARGRELQPKNVDLIEIINAAYKMVGAAADTGSIDFIFDAKPEDAVIEADPEQIERVFINLFTNAVHAMKGWSRQTLKIKLVKEHQKVNIILSDTGKGMPAEVADKIFEPFYSTKDKGTGLGLAIVFNIIKRHDGEIRVESEEGKGTTFFITLPVER